MKKINFIILLLLTLLIGCKKLDTDLGQTGQHQNPNNGVPYTDGPGFTGAKHSTKAEYEQVPAFEVITDAKGGRIGASTITDTDLSDEMPPPDNQGAENSCVAFAVGYALRSNLYHKDKLTSYIAQNYRDDKTVFSPRFMYNLVRQSKLNIDEGMSQYQAYQSLVSVGICTWSTSPYKVGEYTIPVSNLQKQEADNYKIKSKGLGYGRIVLDDISKIKEFINIKIPVSVILSVDEFFQRPHQNIGNGFELINVNGKEEICWKKHGNLSALGHCMVVVGYDDNQRAFKLMNSYGPSWANKGFIWVDYNLFSQLADIDAYFLSSSFANLRSIPIPTGKIDVSYKCDEKVYRLSNEDPNLGTYRYEFLISSNFSYDKELKKYIYLITPDKKSYYKIPAVSSANLDGKTFEAYIIYAPKSVRTFYNSISGEFYTSPIYSTHDVSDLLLDYEVKSSIIDNNFTPTGIYEFMFVVQSSEGKLIQSKRVFFDKPFFDINSCKGLSTTSVKLYTTNF